MLATARRFMTLATGEFRLASTAYPRVGCPAISWQPIGWPVRLHLSSCATRRAGWENSRENPEASTPARNSSTTSAAFLVSTWRKYPSLYPQTWSGWPPSGYTVVRACSPSPSRCSSASSPSAFFIFHGDLVVVGQFPPAVQEEVTNNIDRLARHRVPDPFHIVAVPAVLGVKLVSFQAVPILRIFDVRGKAVAHGLFVSVLADRGHTLGRQTAPALP